MQEIGFLVREGKNIARNWKKNRINKTTNESCQELIDLYTDDEYERMIMTKSAFKEVGEDKWFGVK